MERYIKTLINSNPKRLEDAVKKTVMFAEKKIPETLPKRTGSLRNSYRSKRLGRYSYLFASTELKYADVIEGGMRARTLKAKPGKMLMIPITERGRKQGLTESGARFRRGKTNKGRIKELIESGDIIFRKQVNLKRRKGKFYFRDKIRPAVQNRLRYNVIQAYKGL